MLATQSLICNTISFFPIFTIKATFLVHDIMYTKCSLPALFGCSAVRM